MADWKVSAERVVVLPHPNAERLMLAKVGMYQLVVGIASGMQTHDLVVFVPKRSVLPPVFQPSFIGDTGKSLLQGDAHDRVASRNMRGQLSEGVLLPMPIVLETLGLTSADQLVEGEDLSARLGITLHEPPLPEGFAGELAVCRVVGNQHDVESLNIYVADFVEGEMVEYVEKLHGVQMPITITESGDLHVSSKGLSQRGIEILEDAESVYWRALRNTGLDRILKEVFPGSFVQAFSEVVPTQGANWSYGHSGERPTAYLFRLEVNGQIVPRATACQLDPRIASLWSPIVQVGPFSLATARELAKGREQVSGRQLHIREGVVVSPVIPRRSQEGFQLFLKSINPKFIDSDDTPS